MSFFNVTIVTLKYVRLYMKEKPLNNLKSNQNTSQNIHSKTHNLRTLNASCYHSNEYFWAPFLLITHVFF